LENTFRYEMELNWQVGESLTTPPPQSFGTKVNEVVNYFYSYDFVTKLNVWGDGSVICTLVMVKWSILHADHFPLQFTSHLWSCAQIWSWRSTGSLF
jgi:hypothetical protein